MVMSKINLDKEVIKAVQKLLRLRADGQFGALSTRALNQFLTTHDNNWPIERQVAGLAQYIMRSTYKGNIDGLWGTKSTAAFKEYTRQEDRIPKLHKTEFIPDDNYRSLVAAYGNPGGTSLIRIKLPFKMKLAWDNSVTVSSISCHEKAANDFRNIFNQIHDRYGNKRIAELGIDQFGGIYNYRKKRNSTAWSTHAWGISIDLDPAHNKLRWKSNKARFAKKEFKPMIDIFYANNFISLGKERNYDWMHFQRTTNRR